MCRLFGFRSVISSQVHSSLLEADNALLHQSLKHPDGWGVGYYLGGVPHVIKSTETAVSDSLFRQVGGLVASKTVLAHLRKATLGQVSIVNTHPFQHGRWIFAHNGNIKNFSTHRQQLLTEVDPVLSRYILGDSDSELLFYCLLTEIRKLTSIYEDVPVKVVGKAVKSLIRRLEIIIGPHMRKVCKPTETYLTFILTNGTTMLAFHGGQDLYFSTYKTQCPESEDCRYYGASCESEDPDGSINHLVISSEVLTGTNIFLPLTPGEMVGADHHMIIYRDKIDVSEHRSDVG